MSVDKVSVWNDPRVQKTSAHLNGRTYGYLYAEPKDGYRGTIFLIHGFPDLSAGWRYQIPMLLSLGLRVVAPDCMGYGRTDAPPYTINDYSLKRISDDLAELSHQLGAEQIILGGHDWGGAVVYRFALYYPTLVSSLFSICTPYFPPNPTYKPLALMTRSSPQRRSTPSLRSLNYQIQFASGALEEAIQSSTEIKSLLNAFYGGRKPRSDGDGQAGLGSAFSTKTGIELKGLAALSPTPLLSESELQYYTQEYSRHGIHAPLNWYRTRELNWEDEWEHFFKFGEVEEPPQLEQEVLFILATRDTALGSDLAKTMVETEKGGICGGLIQKLTRREVDAGHWALWERPDEVNAYVRGWLEEVVLKGEEEAKGERGLERKTKL